MNFQNVVNRISGLGLAAACLVSVPAFAQQAPGPHGLRVAEGSNLYCAGYVQTAPVDTGTKIVGAYNEQEKFLYTQNNDVYVNAGANKGVRVGDLMSVTRPRGEVKSHWTRKGDLGFYVEEVGMLEVIRVNPEVSVARVRTSCSGMQLGDLVQPAQPRFAPVYNQRPALDRFADPSGKATGRLFMARDAREMLGREQVVYIDLGAEDRVQVGDYLTIFRPLGSGNLFENDEDYNTDARNYGFESKDYHGGKFSNQAARKSGERARGKVVTYEDAKEGRPSNIRKVVGEAVILNVKERTATAVITRTAQEIHTGDWVEVQ